MSTPTILAISHEATRTGSVRVLIGLLRHLRDHSEMAICVETLVDGPLGPELRAFATHKESEVTPDIVFANSVASAGRILSFPEGTPSIIYIHEEADALAVAPSETVEALRRFTRVLCVSERSRSSIIEMGIVADRVAILPPLVEGSNDVHGPFDEVLADGARTEPMAMPVVPAGLEELHDRQLPLVVGCGEASWRKGTDLFLDVCRRVNDVTPTNFAWVGRRPRGFGRVLDNDVMLLGQHDRFAWIGEVADPGPYFRAARLLVMTSREDPKPLTPFEAAQADTATLGFTTGGLSDMAAEGMAVTVPYPDTAAMATAALELVDDPVRCAEMIARANAFAVEHRSPDTIGPRFLAELARVVTETS